MSQGTCTSIYLDIYKCNRPLQWMGWDAVETSVQGGLHTCIDYIDKIPSGHHAKLRNIIAFTWL